MKTKKITNKLHKIPKDLQKALSSSKSLKIAWEKITPLAQNEWICWVESAKKPETRLHRLKRTQAELIQGKRRPCCWPGCPHR